MRTFRCDCAGRIFFDNTGCLACGRQLGFLPDRGVLAAIEPRPQGLFVATLGHYRKCANYVDSGVCNWMIPAESPDTLCQACRLNNVIPDLSSSENWTRWAEVERAKRRLVYGLNRLHLPLVPKTADPVHGLAFDIKSDTASQRIVTGHAEGLITLNVAEADPVIRERVRVSMNERYRTLLGHFRHEIGHYYWELLVRDSHQLTEFRRWFGDESTDYAQALARHYSNGAPAAWPESFLTAYAAAHPWEDWAETFAHYLHMADTLETAQHFGFTSEQLPDRSFVRFSDFELLMEEWVELTIALNALNRSMGLPDAYPFAISSTARQKLELVHRLVRDQSARAVA